MFVAFLPFLITAQPTLTSNVVAQIGTEITTEIAEDAPDPGPAGADVEWDFREVVMEDSSATITFVYVPSDTTQYYGSFPESNVCQYGIGIGSYNYLLHTNETLENLGNAFGNFRLVYTDPRTLVTFPFTFGSSFTDDYATTSQIAGIDMYGWGTVEVTADAYGRVHLPETSFNNVLRLKTADERIDSTDLGLGIVEKNHTTTTSYIWIDPVSGEAVASHVTSEGFTVALVPPLPPDTSFFGPTSTFSYDPSLTSSVRNLEMIAGQIAPNPFVEGFRLTFNLPDNERLLLRLTTIDGQELLRRQIDGHTGDNTHEIRTGDIAPGTYILHVRGERSYLSLPLLRVD